VVVSTSPYALKPLVMMCSVPCLAWLDMVMCTRHVKVAPGLITAWPCGVYVHTPLVSMLLDERDAPLVGSVHVTVIPSVCENPPWAMFHILISRSWTSMVYVVSALTETVIVKPPPTERCDGTPPMLVTMLPPGAGPLEAVPEDVDAACAEYAVPSTSAAAAPPATANAAAEPNLRSTRTSPSAMPPRPLRRQGRFSLS
jgi:hypothetical protein